MRKLKPKEVDDLRKQLGGKIEIHDSPNVDGAFGIDAKTADARVPTLESLREGRASSPAPDNALESDASVGMASKKKKATSARSSNPGKSDYSVRFSSKNSDRGAKVAIVSSKSKKVVYEQG